MNFWKLRQASDLESMLLGLPFSDDLKILSLCKDVGLRPDRWGWIITRVVTLLQQKSCNQLISTPAVKTNIDWFKRGSLSQLKRQRRILSVTTLQQWIISSNCIYSQKKKKRSNAPLPDAISKRGVGASWYAKTEEGKRKKVRTCEPKSEIRPGNGEGLCEFFVWHVRTN